MTIYVGIGNMTGADTEALIWCKCMDEARPMKGLWASTLCRGGATSAGGSRALNSVQSNVGKPHFVKEAMSLSNLMARPAAPWGRQSWTQQPLFKGIAIVARRFSCSRPGGEVERTVLAAATMRLGAKHVSKQAWTQLSLPVSIMLCKVVVHSHGQSGL